MDRGTYGASPRSQLGATPPIEIGRPADPPSPKALRTLRDAVSTTGAKAVYWFWVSLNHDAPHLGLAVAPADAAVVARVGRAVEPIWKKLSPHNPVFDILRLGDPGLDALIVDQGELLHGTAPS